MGEGPLAGVRVIDLTSVVFGPLCTQTLGDMGADVIKVEPPEGDFLRALGPMRSPGMGALFMNLNRNKRSLALDLKRPEARAALIRLVRDADVFVHNVRPGGLKRLGLDWESLKAEAPRLIHVSLTGFGTSGPYADRPALDDVIQAACGLSDLAAKMGGPGTPPCDMPTIVADKTSGLAAVGAIGMALYQRERTGVGRAVEVPMLETVTAWTLADHLFGHVFEPPVGPIGYDRALEPDRKPFEAADGHVALLPSTAAQWRRCLEALGRSDLAAEPRLSDAAWRTRERPRLRAAIAAETPKRTVADWVALFAAAEVPCMPVNRLEDLREDPHLKAVGFFREMEHPTEGRVVVTAPPLRFEGAEGSIRRLAPVVGEHTAELLAEAGLSPAEIESLAASGACALAPRAAG